VVVAAFLISANTSLDPQHQYPGAYRTRLQEQAFWPVMDFLLETFVFAYIGLQLGFVVADLAAGDEPGLGPTLIAAGVLLLAAIVLRLAGVFLLFGRWQLSDRMMRARLARDPGLAARLAERRSRGRRKRGDRTRLDAPTIRDTAVVGWTGMRGILTLAAAAAVPESVPGRNAIQAIALIVTLGTLLLQGMTIRPLIRWLRLDTSAEAENARVLRARGVEIATAAGEDYDRQRLALSEAMMRGEVDEETARELIGDVDLRQAAGLTLDQDRS
jgi:NhaP-type Na+/H+ or K+/H+ antiporter